MEISLITDYDQSISQDALLVESDGDYVAACCALTDKGKETPKTIWVRKTAHYNWLQGFTNQVKIDAKYIVKTPRLILADNWGVQIPNWLDDETVTSQNLLSLKIDKNEIGRADFESTLLCHCLGKSFDENNFVIANLSSILMDLNQPRSKDNLTILPILEKCLETKINTWKKNSPDKWVKELLTRLSEDAEALL